ncbi:MAG TPA: CvpA family protein [Salinisphaeraceae bacterium]|nr:CvpA family protein [Salinisphaeraceae bacterium]
MNWADFAILAIVALSALIGFFRGFLREVIGLASWILAFYVAIIGYETAASWLQPWIDSDLIRMIAGFAVLFIAVLLLGAIVNYILGRLASKTGFAGTDRVLGGAFGILRGVAILVLLVLFAGMTPVPRDAWWQESVFVGNLQAGAERVRDHLPGQFSDAIVYPSDSEITNDPPASQVLPEEQTSGKSISS